MFVDVGLRALKIVATQPFRFLVVQATEHAPLAGFRIGDDEGDRERVVWIRRRPLVGFGGANGNRESYGRTQSQERIAVEGSIHVLP